jgi:hypothetical protein
MQMSHGKLTGIVADESTSGINYLELIWPDCTVTVPSGLERAAEKFRQRTRLMVSNQPQDRPVVGACVKMILA